MRTLHTDKIIEAVKEMCISANLLAGINGDENTIADAAGSLLRSEGDDLVVKLSDVFQLSVDVELIDTESGNISQRPLHLTFCLSLIHI